MLQGRDSNKKNNNKKNNNKNSGCCAGTVGSLAHLFIYYDFSFSLFSLPFFVFLRDVLSGLIYFGILSGLLALWLRMIIEGV